MDKFERYFLERIKDKSFFSFNFDDYKKGVELLQEEGKDGPIYAFIMRTHLAFLAYISNEDFTYDKLLNDVIETLEYLSRMRTIIIGVEK